MRAVQGGNDKNRQTGYTMNICLHLFQVVGQRQQRHGAGETIALKVAAQAVTQHRHVVLVGQAVQLLHLRGRKELRLVDQQAGDGAGLAFVQPGRVKHRVGAKGLGLARQAQA
jgi:hypothetical protein